MIILLFLGSWRSTLIIAISIPLSILSSIIVLSAMGETMNTMTLGGLALAIAWKQQLRGRLALLWMDDRDYRMGDRRFLERCESFALACQARKRSYGNQDNEERSSSGESHHGAGGCLLVLGGDLSGIDFGLLHHAASSVLLPSLP